MASRAQARSKHGPSDTEQALRDDNARLLATNRDLRKRAGNEEWLVAEVEKRIAPMGPLPKVNLAPTIVAEREQYARPLAVMLNIADPHMEEVVDPNETEGLLEWNFPKFLRSAWYLGQTAVELVNIIRARHKVDELYLNFLGDMVTGEIHPDVYYTNAFYLPDALTVGPWYWSQFIRELSAHFDRIYVTCIFGNHGRLDHKPTSKRAAGRNWDTCLYQSTAVLCRELANVEWRIPRSPKCVVEANGWYFLLQHGDRVAQHGGTMPYYGMARQRSSEIAKRLGFRVRDIERQLKAGLLFDYDIRGHHHVYGTTDERTLLCPSMMGNNEFGQDNTFGNKMPGARLFFVDEQHGMAGDWRINLIDLPETHGFVELPGWAQ